MLNTPLSFTDPSGFSWWTKWRRKVVAAATWVATAWLTGGCISCANYAAAAVRAGMDAHAAGTNVFRGIASAAAGMFLGGNILGGGMEAALNGGNRRQIWGAIAASVAGVGGEYFLGRVGSAMIRGCVGGVINRGRCGAGVRDAMISMGIDAAKQRAYEYAVTNWPSPQLSTRNGSKDAPLRIETTAHLDATRARIATELPELLPAGTKLEFANPFVQLGMAFGDFVIATSNSIGCCCCAGFPGVEGVTLAQTSSVSRFYGLADLSSAEKDELMGLAVHELLHAYLFREIGSAAYHANEPSYHDWIYTKGSEATRWAQGGFRPQKRPVIALLGGGNP